MFSVQQKRQIADAVQRILRETGHPELPVGEISFYLKVQGAEDWSWADIRNNGAVTNPSVNPWNEAQAQVSAAAPAVGELSPRETEAQKSFTLIRDRVLNGIDGLENDQINYVLDIIDDFTPDWV